MDPQISVVVPMHNESLNVLPLAQRVFESLAKETDPIELILVDDGSTDDTWEKILSAQKSDPRVSPARHPKARGQSAALWTGFRQARAPVICTLDGDLQNDPADLPMMIGLLSDADMVCGVRARRADTFIRRASSKVARGARKGMLGVDFLDTGCNLRVFRRTVLDNIPGFDGIHRFMPIFAHNTGWRVKEVPVRHHARTQGVSKYGLWNRLGRGIRDLIMVRWFLRRQIGRKL
jgi:dolichol-phosphate mannosyltransferase